MSWAHQDVPCWRRLWLGKPPARGDSRVSGKDMQQTGAVGKRVRPHHRFILAELLCQIDSINETIKRFNEQRFLPPLRRRYNCWTLHSWGGTADRRGNCLRNGTDMSRFPSANHLAAWAGLAPGNHESAGKRLSGKTRYGNQVLAALVPLML